MQPGNFQFCEKKKIIRLSGKAYDEDLLNDLLKLIIIINTKYKNTNIIITGSFDSKLILQDLISKIQMFLEKLRKTALSEKK